jgi:hypothetical protein
MAGKKMKRIRNKTSLRIIHEETLLRVIGKTESRKFFREGEGRILRTKRFSGVEFFERIFSMFPGTHSEPVLENVSGMDQEKPTTILLFHCGLEEFRTCIHRVIEIFQKHHSYRV